MLFNHVIYMLQGDESAVLTSEFGAAAAVIKKNKLTSFTKTYFLEIFQKSLRREIVPNFWTYFRHWNVHDENIKLTAFTDAVNYLHSRIKDYSLPIQRLAHIVECSSDERRLKEHLQLLLRAILLSQLPLNYETCIQSFYSKIFKVYQAKQKIEGLYLNCASVIIYELLYIKMTHLPCISVHLFKTAASRFIFVAVLFSVTRNQ